MNHENINFIWHSQPESKWGLIFKVPIHFLTFPNEKSSDSLRAQIPYSLPKTTTIITGGKEIEILLTLKRRELDTLSSLKVRREVTLKLHMV